jgi:hypothetical protein
LKKIAVMLLVFVLTFFAGCATFNVNDYVGTGTPETRAFVYGYILYDEPFSEMSWLILLQAAPKAENGGFYKYGAYIKKGIFFNGNLRLGSYKVSQFGGGDSVYDLGGVTEGFRFEKPGIYYMGAYRVNKDKGLFSSQFGLEKIDGIKEADILRPIVLLCAGTKWEAELNKRLNKLEAEK